MHELPDARQLVLKNNFVAWKLVKTIRRNLQFIIKIYDDIIALAQKCEGETMGEQ